MVGIIILFTVRNWGTERLNNLGQRHTASRCQTLDFNSGIPAPELMPLITTPYVLMMFVVWLLYLPYPRNMSFKLRHFCWIRSPFDFAMCTTKILLVWVAIAPSMPLTNTPAVLSKLPSVGLAWLVNEFGQFPVAISGQLCLLGHRPHLFQPHWSHCLCWALTLLLPWSASHQSLPGVLSSVLKTRECSHCARAPGVCSEVRTVPQAPFLFQILGLSSRHIEIFGANCLSGVFGFVFLADTFFVFTPDLSPWQTVSRLGLGQILMTNSGLC